MAKGDYGFNCFIGAPGIGRRRVRVTRFVRKVNIIPGNEGEAKRRRSFSGVMVTASGFTIEIAFVSYEERGKFNRWLSKWMEDVVNNTSKTGVLTVSIPYYNFVQICVPETALEYGEGMGDMGYRLTMGFVGASDAINLDLGARMAGVSYFQQAESNTTSKYFYPAGKQVKGVESLDGTIFDTTPYGDISQPGRPGEDTGFGPAGGF